MTVGEWLRLSVVFLVAVNPVRVRFGVVGAERATRLRNAAVGAVVAAVVVVGLAASASPLLDTWDASAPTLRIGAGLLVVLGGARDAVARMPAPEPSAPGWWAGLVPLAVPLLVTPMLLGVSLSAGADEGVGPALGSTAPALALVVLLSAPALPVFRGEGTGRRAASWAARLTGALAVVVGILLAADGVFDV